MRTQLVEITCNRCLTKETVAQGDKQHWGDLDAQAPGHDTLSNIDLCPACANALWAWFELPAKQRRVEEKEDD
jgi:hypothetical protein